MKSKLNTVDILSLVNDFQRLINMRVNNVYDGNNPQIYFMKLNHAGNKELLYIESGIRMHTTKINFSVFRDAPSSFAGKLRKHLKNKRIVEISQVGLDRIIKFKFGEGDYTNYVLFEFHSSGNIILTDKDYKILSQRRYHVYDEENKHFYPIDKFEKIDLNETNPLYQVIEKRYRKYDKDSTNQIEIDKNGESIDYEKILSKIKNENLGFIIEKQGNYVDFTSFLCNSENHENIETFNCFSDAVDKYYLKNNPSKINHKLTNTQAKKKTQIGKIERKEGHLKNQVIGLEKKTEKLLSKATIIEENMQLIEYLIKRCKNYRINGYSEREILETIKINYKELKVSKVDLKDEYFTIKLENTSIDIYFNQNAYDNISRYHSLKKHSKSKHEKSKIILENELSKAKKKEESIIKRPLVKVINKTYWYESYHWFMSNDGFLVICGRNAEQNEQIVKKYLEKNDMYVHADFHGSGSCVVKSNNKQIPISTLEQAGTFVLCFSKAWQSNVSDRAYYVNYDQVSKTAPTGEYLSTGSMMVRGKKNYLSMSYLELSVGILFKVEGDDKFKTRLTKDDKVVESKAMIAPTKTLINAQYKVKVVPGTAKRNKTLENILSRFRLVKSITNEYDYVFSIKKPDLDTLIPQKSKKI